MVGEFHFVCHECDEEAVVKYLGGKPRGFTVLGPHRTRRRI
jgi:hypothetical protein